MHVTRIKSKSIKNWLSKDIQHSIKTHSEFVKNDRNSTTTTNNSKPHKRINLTKSEIDSLNEFKNRNDIIIRKDDGGGAVVIIMSADDYISQLTARQPNYDIINLNL